MPSDEILQKLLVIARRELDEESIVFDEQTSFKSIPEWDSLNHLRMVWAMEKTFAVRFVHGDLDGLGTVGELLDLIARKIQASSGHS